jgi:hypothetical protein
VEVALHPAAFGVPGLDNAPPRRPYLLELGPDLGLQPLVHDRHPGRRGSGADEPLVERRVANQRRQQLALPLHYSDGLRLPSAAGPRQRRRPPVCIHPPVLAVQRVQQLQRRVAERAS